MTDNQIKDIFFKYYHNTATPLECQELYRWMSSDKNKERAEFILHEFYDEEFKNNGQNSVNINTKDILQEIFRSTDQNTQPIYSKPRKLWVKITAAASILLALSVLGYYYISQNGLDTPVLSTRSNLDDIPAGGKRALLILSDGKRILLDSLKDDFLIEENGIKIDKLEDGQLIYTVNADTEFNPNNFNTIETPSGGFYQITLHDGTKVWLNALSSLKFPTAFSSKERKVELVGEAYFEVAPNKSKPFIVNVNNTSIKVLGTHFNINSYSTDSQTYTTVLEGAVSVTHAQQKQIVYPGSMLTCNKNGDMRVANGVDLNQIIAWKNGYFNTSTITLHQLMDEVSRWYGVEIIYNTDTNTEFVGRLPKDISIKDLITLLELTGELKFSLTSKTLTIMSNN